MVTPTPYTRYRDYSQYQADNPDTEINGSDLDTDFDRLKTTTDTLRTSLATIRRDDGALKNGIVTVDSLSSDTLTTLALDGNVRGDWTAAEEYVAGDIVRVGSPVAAVGYSVSGTGSVTSLTALKALEAPSIDMTVVTQYRSAAGDGGGGTWVWRSGDRSANVSADPGSFRWAAPTGASTGASGAWQLVGLGSSPDGNTWAGAGAAGSLTTGDQNTAFGTSALAGITTDTYSDAFGYRALVNATGHANAAFGAGAGGSVTSGYDNVFVGADCGRNADDSGYLTGWNNVGVGVHALGHTTSGTHNVAIGNYALVGGGYYTGFPSALLTGSYNVAVGHLALGTAYGAASENVAVGYLAGSAVTTGTQNIFVGSYAGRNQVTGDLNILIGRDVSATSTTASNQLNIGNLLRGTGLNQGGAPSTGSISIGLPLASTPSNTLHIYNATQAGVRLDTGAGGGAYYTDINQQTNGVLNITPPSAGYVNVTGSQVITGSLTVGPSATPATYKTDTASGGTALYGAANSATQSIRSATLVARGTVASPSAVQSGDLIASPLDVRGYDGAAYRQAVDMLVYATGTISSGVVPGYLAIRTANASGVMTNALVLDSSQNATFGGYITVAHTTMIATSVSFGDGAAAQTGTLTNAPAAGNPTKWIPIYDNGVTRYIPAW